MTVKSSALKRQFPKSGVRGDMRASPRTQCSSELHRFTNVFQLLSSIELAIYCLNLSYTMLILSRPNNDTMPNNFQRTETNQSTLGEPLAGKSNP
jgi:hypothetical protein